MRNYRSPRSILRNYQIKKYFQKVENVLEVGSGNFNLAQVLYGKYDQFIGVDFAKEISDSYERLPFRIKDHVKYKCGDVFDLPKKSLYDAVIACEIMEHIEKDQEFLMKLYEFIQPDGFLYLSVPAKMKYWSIDDEIFGHYRRYEKNELKKFVESVGFQSVEIISYAFPFSHVLRWMRQLYTLLFLQSRSGESKKERSKKSGINQMGKFSSISNIFINNVTLFPFNILSSMFISKDWSDGYIVVAKRN